MSTIQVTFADKEAKALTAKPDAVSVPMMLADFDEERRMLYLIVTRPDIVNSYGGVFSMAETELSCHRSMGLKIGINHLCATDGCLHSFGEHVDGATTGQCKAEGCDCGAYDLLEAPAEMVENIFMGVDTDVWHGRQLTEPFKAGDHVIGLKVHGDTLWAFRGGIRGSSWEGSAEAVPIEGA